MCRKKVLSSLIFKPRGFKNSLIATFTRSNWRRLRPVVMKESHPHIVQLKIDTSTLKDLLTISTNTVSWFEFLREEIFQTIKS